MRLKMLLWILSLLVALASLGSAGWAATNVREVEEDNSLVSSFVTPHKAWGQGYAGGKVRALFFVYTGGYDGTWEDTGTRVREVVELAQRFDIEADAALFCGRGNEKWQFHGQKLGEQRAERLLEQPYELYVIAGFPMEKLPAKIQYLILKQVAEGAGLLCCGQGAAEYLTPKRAIEPAPEMLTAGLPVLDGKQASEVVGAYRLGKGRGVWLKYAAHALSPRHEFTWRGLAEYDYWMMLVGRAALWAASKDVPLAVTSVTTRGPLAVPVGDESLGEIGLHNSADRPVQVRVEPELRRACDGLKLPLEPILADVPAGDVAQLAVPLPYLRAGDYYIDAIVRTQSAVEAFGAAAFTVQSAVGVAEITTAATFVEVGESISGAVALKGPVPEGAVLRLRFRDSYDRVLRQEDRPLGQDDIGTIFEYEASEACTNLMRVEALLLVAGREVDMADTSFSVPKRRHDRFNFVMWDAAMDVLGYYSWRGLQEAGQDICLLGSMGGQRKTPPSVHACDGSLVPYSTRILDPKDEEGFMQPVCWNDEPAVTEYVDKIVDNQKNLREQGVFVYSLGDEGVTKGCCVHPSCIAAYRRYLERQYGTIDALNASWDTDYASFDVVDLLDRKDNMEAAALKTCYPRWYDRQAFARYNLMQFSGRFVEAYRELDPQAKTGFEGTGGFGDDYDAILGTNTFYGPYPDIGDDIVRGAAPRSMVRSNWMGYSKTGDALSDAAWRMVMRSMDSIWYWMWSGIGNWRGYQRPTFDYWPAIDDLTEEMRPVRQGLGDLVIKSEIAHSKIAIFYSLPSALSGQLENGSEFISPKGTHETWTRLTSELGLDFRYLTSNLLKGAELSNDEFRVLLLPMTQAISAEEADVIRDFCRNGGTVIADVRPGIYDGHCKPIAPGALDDLFGIQRTGRGKVAEVAVSVEGTLGDAELELDFAAAKVDTEVQATAATALGHAGESPTMLVNTFGQGRAILLNFQLLSTGADDEQAAAARRLLDAVYATAGAQAPIKAGSPNGDPLPLTETRVWRNGRGLIFGLWRQMENAWFSPKTGTVAGEPVPAKISLPAEAHLYDLRAGKYLGATSETETALRWGRASFYLALPYRIGQASLALSSTAPTPGQTLTADIRLQVPDDSEEQLAVWAEVTAPDGSSPLWGRQVVLLQGGSGQVRIPVAHNDAPGQWKMTVRELFSGESAEASWTVSG